MYSFYYKVSKFENKLENIKTIIIISMNIWYTCTKSYALRLIESEYKKLSIYLITLIHMQTVYIRALIDPQKCFGQWLLQEAQNLNLKLYNKLNTFCHTMDFRHTNDKLDLPK